MISGAGMLDFLACHSVEKLVIDAEAIASAQRLLEGIAVRTETLATMMMAAAISGDFLSLPETRRLFRSEQHFPSSVIDRSSGMPAEPGDTFCRARTRVAELLASYQRPRLAVEVEDRLRTVVQERERRFGVERLPGI
jgi:trimethylamine:corrinoid methyltransferase-like protein